MNAATQYNFDDRHVKWVSLGFDHVMFSMLAVDPARRLVDFLARFSANQKIVMHRHLAQTNILVIQGEHRIYEPDGRLREIRPVGSYTATAPGGGPHVEGGGDTDCVVIYSLRGDTDAMFEIMDDQQNVVAVLGIDDFKSALAEQNGVG